ncbi:MAG: hypothetical protein ACXW0U_07670 [Halobacteriota archaeon]
MVSRSEAAHPPVDRVAEFFPTYYVTLISIIQVTAFGYLLLVAKDQLSSILAGTYDPLWTVLIVGFFIMIVATWMSYTHYVTSLRLKPTSLDALIPFCFGATQALVIFSISLQQLAWFYFAMVANAAVAISQTYVLWREVRLHQEYEEHRVWIEKSRSLSVLPRWYAVRLLIFLSFGVAEALFNLHSLLLAIVYLGLCIMSFVVVGRGAKRMASTS